MADSLQSLYSSPAMQQSNVAQDTSQASQGASTAVMDSVKTGIGLATMQNQVEKSNNDLKEQQLELQTKKYNQFTGFMQTLARTSPAIAKRMLPSMIEASRKSDNPIDPAILETMASDEEYKRRYQSMSDMIMNGAGNPGVMGAGLSAAQEIGKFDSLLGAAIDKQKSDSSQAATASESTKAQDSAEDIADTKASATTDAADARKTFQQERMQIQKDKMDEGIHQRVLTGISKDEQLKKQLYQVNNLENAIGIFKAGGNPTGQQFEELQQAVRSNLGIKGTSGVGEREATKLKSMGIKVSEFEQWLSGKPIDIRDLGGQPLIDHVMDMANNELKQTRMQSEKKLKVLSGGHEDFYKRRGDMKASLDNYVEGFGDLYKPQGEQAAPKGPPTMPSPAPQDPNTAIQAFKSKLPPGFDPAKAISSMEKALGKPLTPDQKKIFGGQ